MKLTTINTLQKWSLIFALLVITLSCVFHREVYRLYKVIFLFDESTIVSNFQHMSEIFPFHEINKGSTNFQFKSEPVKLTASVDYKGRSYTLENLLNESVTTGFLVIKDGKILREEYRLGNSVDGLNISWSVNKSFVSALIGIAIDEGYIKSIEDPVSSYVPMLKNTGYDSVSLKNVLQMSSGVGFDEDYAAFFSDINRMGRVVALGQSINEFAASLKSERPSGQFHQYVSMDTQVLGMVLKNATGVTPSKYLEDKIWKKLGMRSNAKWLIDDQGMELAFGTLNVTLRDYARFGLLYLRQGDWFGEQIVPQQWVIDSTTANEDYLKAGNSQLQASEIGYGYQWWLPAGQQGDFLARGVYGQYIYVNPTRQVVIVKTSADAKWRSGADENIATIRMFQEISANL